MNDQETGGNQLSPSEMPPPWTLAEIESCLISLEVVSKPHLVRLRRTRCVADLFKMLIRQNVWRGYFFKTANQVISAVLCDFQNDLICNCQSKF